MSSTPLLATSSSWGPAAERKLLMHASKHQWDYFAHCIIASSTQLASVRFLAAGWVMHRTVVHAHHQVEHLTQLLRCCG